MNIGDFELTGIPGERTILTLTLDNRFIERLTHYASQDNRPIGLLIIEACEQLMRRYRKSEADRLEKRVEQLIAELEGVLHERASDNS